MRRVNLKGNIVLYVLIIYCNRCLLTPDAFMVSQVLDTVSDILQGSTSTQWHPAALPDRKDLECLTCVSATKADTEPHEKEKCCSCYARAIWEGTQLDLEIEYISSLGKGYFISKSPVNKTRVYQVIHRHGELTDLPLNLCNNNNLHRSNSDKTFEQFWNRIVTINLSFNRIRRIVDINCLKNLDSLDLSSNCIIKISNTSFTRLSHLRFLNLKGNMIKTLDAATLSAPSMHLSRVDLSFNKMETLDVTNIMSQYPYCEFDFSNNKMERISNELHFKLNLSRTYGPGMVIFSNNTFHEFPDFQDLLSLDTIAQLGSLIQFGFDFRNIQVHCDCILEPLLEKAKDFVEQFWRDYMNVKCVTPVHLQGVPLVNVSLSDFICKVDQRHGCPKLCSCIDKPSNNTIFVNCSNSNLKDFPEHVPHSKFSTNIELDLSGNGISNIPNVSFLENVTMLNMSSNRLVDFDGDAADALSMAIIDLSGNGQLHHLPQALQYRQLSQIRLDDVVLECNCDSTWLSNWVSVKGSEDIKDVLCNVPGHGTMPVNKFSKDLLDCDQSENSLLVVQLSLIIAALLVVLCITGAFISTFKYELLILVLKMRQTSKHSVMPSFDYDVFLSFDDQNDKLRNWVNCQLLKYLEDSGYNIFYPLRDLTFGSERSSETIDVLQRAKHFILILSDSYLDQEDHIWTDNEWKYGWHMLRTDARRKIVLVNYDHISPSDVDHQQIKAYLRVGETIEFDNHHGDLLDTIALKLGPPYMNNLHKYSHGFDNRKMKHSCDMFAANVQKPLPKDKHNVNDDLDVKEPINNCKVNVSIKRGSRISGKSFSIAKPWF